MRGVGGELCGAAHMTRLVHHLAQLDGHHLGEPEHVLVHLMGAWMMRYAISEVCHRMPSA